MIMAKTMKDIHNHVTELTKALNEVIIGQQDVVKQILVAMFCNAHALLESVPGLGKTTMVMHIADSMKLTFSRIQSTPDLMPSDITGTLMVLDHHGKQVLEFQKGPVFANIVLADEINRATPKTQSAMLEAMQERQVTVAGTTYPLDIPFLVLATQNPIDQEGTYPLPEAQTDRFLLKILVDYPTAAAEQEIVAMYGTNKKGKRITKAVISKEELQHIQEIVTQMPISKELQEQIIQLVQRTRSDQKYIRYGASPRASIGLTLASKAHALLSGRNYVTRQDVLTMAGPVLRHRLLLTFVAEQEGKDVEQIIADHAKVTIKG